MIRLDRGVEPGKLPALRRTELDRFRPIFAAKGFDRKELGDRYTEVKSILWQRQLFKCCYCERLVTQLYNDVEHFRPKGRAMRGPGCTEEHGYFWLAFDPERPGRELQRPAERSPWRAALQALPRRSHRARPPKEEALSFRPLARHSLPQEPAA